MKQITEDYCSYDIAQLLKEKGFDRPQSPFYSEQDMDEWRQENSYVVQNPDYNPDIPFDSETTTMVAPHISQSLALKWLREVHNIHISINVGCDVDNKNYIFYIPTIVKLNNKSVEYIEPFGEDDNEFDSSEQAVEAAIKYTLENLI